MGGIYYLSNNENAVEVLNTLGAHLKWSFHVNEQEINGYTVPEFRSYDKDLQLKQKYYKHVKDPSGRVQTIVSYDTITNQPISTLKIYHIGGLQVPDELEGILWKEDAEIIFRVNENGINIRMNYECLTNTPIWNSLEHFQLDAGTLFLEEMFPGDMLNYFTSLELVPNF